MQPGSIKFPGLLRKLIPADQDTVIPGPCIALKHQG